jgi:hypothetical protein
MWMQRIGLIMNIFAHTENDMVPWLAILLVILIVSIGYWEIKAQKRKTAGLTTWAFAVPPFCAIVFWIATWELLTLPIRIIGIGAIVFSVAKILVFLYKNAHNTQQSE